MYDIVVVGGGVAGLINAILLARKGLKVALFEKNTYPFHRVCGEYVSNEVKDFLHRNDLYPSHLELAKISKFTLTSVNGKQAHLDLDLGGFGISRYAFDYYLFQKAQETGVEVFQNAKVTKIDFADDIFHVNVGSKAFDAKLVISAHGKRSSLDQGRNFMKKKSPYLAVKYHIKIDFPEDTIALHNFEGGYCGLSKVENNTYNLCYLSHRDNLRYHKDITKMEQNVLHQNPFLKSIWNQADFIFDKPMVINEISFEQKLPVENHQLMSGDTAGMITPLCGNGMAMAIRSANLLSSLISNHWTNDKLDRSKLEQAYTKQWNKAFSQRLMIGRQIQRLFGSVASSNIGVQLVRVKPIAIKLMSLTHGKSF